MMQKMGAESKAGIAQTPFHLLLQKESHFMLASSPTVIPFVSCLYTRMYESFPPSNSRLQIVTDRFKQM